MYFQTIYFLRKFSFLQNDQSFILKKKTFYKFNDLITTTTTTKFINYFVSEVDSFIRSLGLYFHLNIFNSWMQYVGLENERKSSLKVSTQLDSIC